MTLSNIEKSMQKMIFLFICGIFSGGLVSCATSPTDSSVTNSSPEKDYEQFRVGDYYVKAITAYDQKVMFGGTGRGIITYDLREYANSNERVNINYDIEYRIFHLAVYEGKVFASTYGGGLWVKELGGNWVDFGKKFDIREKIIYEVYRAKNGDYWIGTEEGVYQVLGGDFQNQRAWRHYDRISTNLVMLSQHIMAIEEDANGAIWFGTVKGLLKYDGGKWKVWSHVDGVGEKDVGVGKKNSREREEEQYQLDAVISLSVDRNGAIWAGTQGGGVVRYKDGSFRNYTREDGLPSSFIWATYVSRDGSVWIGTEKGLAKYNDENDRFIVFDREDGLYSDFVYSIVEDANKGMWIGGDGGVLHIANVNKWERNKGRLGEISRSKNGPKKGEKVILVSKYPPSKGWLSSSLWGHYYDKAKNARVKISKTTSAYRLFIDAPQAKFDCAISFSKSGNPEFAGGCEVEKYDALGERQSDVYWWTDDKIGFTCSSSAKKQVCKGEFTLHYAKGGKGRVDSYSPEKRIMKLERTL